MAADVYPHPHSQFVGFWEHPDGHWHQVTARKRRVPVVPVQPPRVVFLHVAFRSQTVEIFYLQWQNSITGKSVSFLINNCDIAKEVMEARVALIM